MSASFAFPQSLAEKYRPLRIADFVGLEKPKKIATAFCRAPREAAFLFVGGPGVGKTSLGLAMANELGAELHLINSAKCTAAILQDTIDRCYYVPLTGGFHLVLVDEIDAATPAAQLALLSKLDATARPPKTIFVFTCNDSSNLERRFLSRCMTLEFSTYGLRGELASFLERIWKSETDATPTVNFERMAKEANGGIRESLMELELSLLEVA